MRLPLIGPHPASFSFIFVLFTDFLHKNSRHQQDSNSDFQSRRVGRWPLDLHHGLYVPVLVKKDQQLNEKEARGLQPSDKSQLASHTRFSKPGFRMNDLKCKFFKVLLSASSVGRERERERELESWKSMKTVSSIINKEKYIFGTRKMHHLKIPLQ